MTDYLSALNKARSDLAEANEQKKALDVKIVRLKQAIDALSALAGETPQGELPDYSMISALGNIAPLLGGGSEEMGMTDACRDALIAGARYMTPLEVKEQMETMNFTFKGKPARIDPHCIETARG